MCGVAGTYAYAPGLGPVDPACLRRSRDRMAARGPDGAGEWLSADGRAGLAHRRLAIIDLSEGGAQPMQTRDGRCVISFNGEIYNYRELRAGLEQRGRRFATQSDTEVLLQLYEEHGIGMLSHLRGMFAFALWDSHSRAMYIARDPFGIKPLYYADQGGVFRVASQVKALLACDGIDTAPEPAGHAGFLLWGSVPEPWTMYRGIRALPAGHWMTVDDRGPGAPTEYCSIPGEIRRACVHLPAPAQALEALDQALRRSVAAHRVADVPVGLFLSAGLDSALLASLSAQQDQATRAVTLAFDETTGTRNDEALLATRIASTCGIAHSVAMVDREAFRHARSRIVDAMDQPTIDGVNTWFVSQAAAQAGLKVALSGLGGDELFGSYPSFLHVPRIRNAVAPLRVSRGFGQLARRALLPLLGPWTSPKYAGLLEHGGTTAGAYLLRRCLHLPAELPRILGTEMARAGLERLQTMPALEAAASAQEGDYAEVAALETSWYMRNQLLQSTDWASMAHGVEVRVPLVDLEVLRAAVRCKMVLPALTKAAVVAHSAPNLPRAVLDRPKTGFVVPVEQWLRTERRRSNAEGRGLRAWATEVHACFAGG